MRASPEATAAPATGSDRAGHTVVRRELVSMATKVGCSSPAYKKAGPGGADVGVMGTVDCVAGDKEHIFVLMKPKTSPWAAALVMKHRTKSATVPYLRGDNWGLFVMSVDGGKLVGFDERAVEDAQRKIGAGEIATA